MVGVLDRQHDAPVDWGTHLATQFNELRARGSRVETIFPNSDSEPMFATMRWTCRCVRPLLEPVTTWAELLPSRSLHSGADAQQPTSQVLVRVPLRVGAAMGSIVVDECLKRC